MKHEDVEKYSCYPKTYAASALGLSVSDLIKECRELGYNRWPYNAKRKNKEVEDMPFRTFKFDTKIQKESKKQKVQPILSNLKNQITNPLLEEKILSNTTKTTSNFIIQTPKIQEPLSLPSFSEFIKIVNNKY
jgi:hypothetical protein